MNQPNPRNAWVRFRTPGILFALSMGAFGMAYHLLAQRARLPEVRAGVTPLEAVPIDETTGRVSAAFTPEFSCLHYVDVRFSSVEAKPVLQELVKRWEAEKSKGNSDGPELSWVISEGGKKRYSGSGRQWVSSANGNQLMLGQVELKSGHHYQLLAELGSTPPGIRRFRPEMGVGVLSVEPSYILYRIEHADKNIAFGFITAGVVLLFLVALTLRSTRTPPALAGLLILVFAISASFSASVQARPVSFIR